MPDRFGLDLNKNGIIDIPNTPYYARNVSWYGNENEYHSGVSETELDISRSTFEVELFVSDDLETDLTDRSYTWQICTSDLILLEINRHENPTIRLEEGSIG